ncbi:MAG TPA: flagellar hook-basal body complex protein FliE [Terracidiphilus sp.]|nr:flagellar hook-basal body complex protein FliE [Terracidiphilus sp.]
MQASVQAIQNVGSDSVSFGTALVPNSGAKDQTAGPFSDLLADSIGQINTLESQARSAVDGLMTGSGVDVHQAMLATQKVEMAFELALAVRNKAIQAYQQVMGMQF